MKIAQLQPRQTNVDVEGTIKDIGEPRTFEKFGKSGKVANAILKDESGQVKLSLWNEQCDQVKTGDKVRVAKGYVGEWQGELQLTTGKFGTLEVVGEPSSQATDDELKEVGLVSADKLKEPTPQKSVTPDKADDIPTDDQPDLQVEEEKIE